MQRHREEQKAAEGQATASPAVLAPAGVAALLPRRGPCNTLGSTCSGTSCRLSFCARCDCDTTCRTAASAQQASPPSVSSCTRTCVPLSRHVLSAPLTMPGMAEERGAAANACACEVSSLSCSCSSELPATAAAASPITMSSSAAHTLALMLLVLLAAHAVALPSSRGCLRGGSDMERWQGRRAATTAQHQLEASNSPHTTHRHRLSMRK